MRLTALQRIFVARHANGIHQRIRCELFWPDFVARTRLPNYAARKVLRRASKKRIAGDTAREARDLKEAVAEQTLELRLLKKICSGWGDEGGKISLNLNCNHIQKP
ncbi:MAG: hypothetical protein ACJAVO_002653 [Parvibaculaceae bacterium]|jgi:hypothetical protein